MKHRKLPFGAASHPPTTEGAVDCIRIDARHHGVLALDGQFSDSDPHPRYRVVIHATNRQAVRHEERLLGSRERYVVRVEVANFNDSLAFAELIVPDRVATAIRADQERRAPRTGGKRDCTE